MRGILSIELKNLQLKRPKRPQIVAAVSGSGFRVYGTRFRLNLLIIWGSGGSGPRNLHGFLQRVPFEGSFTGSFEGSLRAIKAVQSLWGV